VTAELRGARGDRGASSPSMGSGAGARTRASLPAGGGGRPAEGAEPPGKAGRGSGGAGFSRLEGSRAAAAQASAPQRRGPAGDAIPLPRPAHPYLAASRRRALCVWKSVF